MRFNWTFDPQNHSLRAPSGRTVTVREIATWLQDRVAKPIHMQAIHAATGDRASEDHGAQANIRYAMKRNLLAGKSSVTSPRTP
ncbi:MAG TPA: hypothetical protein VFG49_06765 [Dyella sp.]|uniref:hypothetical protein n=1 Tax=Dyella sp. TaxID=1869338 RepID=UPI002D7971C1|nr:hypothetical protein [Dyella sp.]HET6553227.1 hypothetical protein [Dyella sp.]